MVRNTRLNIAFLGCGRVADHYLNLIVTEALDGINLIACCDLDSDAVPSIFTLCFSFIRTAELVTFFF